MKNKELKAFQQLVFKQISVHIKRYTLLNVKEIKKIFSAPQLYGAFLYWFIYRSGKAAGRKPIQEIIDALAILEILITADILHQNVEEGDSFSSTTAVSGEQAVLLKNTHKILLGDMLITTAINTINSLTDHKLQKAFYSQAQRVMLDRIEKFLPSNSQKIKKSQNWISLLPQLSKKERQGSKGKADPLTQLFGGKSSCPEDLEEKIVQLEKNFIVKEFDKKLSDALSYWLRGQVLDGGGKLRTKISKQ